MNAEIIVLGELLISRPNNIVHHITLDISRGRYELRIVVRRVGKKYFKNTRCIQDLLFRS